MNRVEAGRLGGNRTRDKHGLVQCPACHRIILNKRTRQRLGLTNQFMDMGKKGGEEVLRRYGREHFVELGRRGGRGNTREKRLSRERRENQ